MTTHNGQDHAERDNPIPGDMPAYGSNSQTLTERELEVVNAVSEAFAGAHLETSIIPVHTLEGTQVDTLRFTLSGLASSDLHRDRIAGGDSINHLASEVVLQLRHQLPVKLDEDAEPEDTMAATAASMSSNLPTSQVVHDPVCHMDIPLDDAYGRVTHEGLTYYFCSEECETRFKASPDQVLEAETMKHAEVRAV
jgi:YHS domain-containing protein